MSAYVPLKRCVKLVAGGLAAASNRLVRASPAARMVVLMYHRVADPGYFDSSVDDWNVTPKRFERQMEWVSQHARCITLGEIQARLAEPVGVKPLVAVTFDDGYSNFATHALPVLERHGVSATVFLVTGYVGTKVPYAFDRWAQRNWFRTERDCWAPLSWDQVEYCASTGLVNFASHSNTHFNPAGLGADAIVREVFESRSELERRLGKDHASAYAYPYGSTRLGDVTAVHVEAVRRAGFSLGFTAEPGAIGVGADVFTLPRVEVHAWDGSEVLAAKARGFLWPFKLTGFLRRSRRLREPVLMTADGTWRPTHASVQARAAAVFFERQTRPAMPPRSVRHSGSATNS